MTIDNRIAALRVAMNEHRFDAYIIPSSDPHQSEYVADHWQSRSWISGFTGSAGTVVVTKNHAGLWTDSRYFIQAEEELKNSEFVLHRLGVPHTPEQIGWILASLEENSIIGIDGNCFSIAQLRNMQKKLNAKNITIEYSQDLIQAIWSARPSLPTTTIFEHDKKYAGKSRKEKLEIIRAKMAQKQIDYHLIATLDDIAWVFNIRGKDVDCNPVGIAYGLIEAHRAYLFIDEQKVPLSLIKILEEDGVKIKSYDEIRFFLDAIPDKQRILIDPNTTSVRLYNAINPNCTKVEGATISTRLKAVKNEIEIEHLKRTMIKDGVALVKLYRWLEDEVKQRPVPETEVADILAKYRSEQEAYFGESFSAIVGWKGNGAIVHYRAEEKTCASIKGDGMLLLDSGGQYFDGTTDITRTTFFGAPTAEQKRNYTLVLKGHIGIATLKFPSGLSGSQMDILARQHLWDEGLNYGHGTGHGVGFFLNVHEGPQGIGPGKNGRYGKAMEIGMITSNEPGFYKVGAYGIRIENLILTVADQTTDFGEFLKFETLTLFPIAINLIEKSLLTDKELDWINTYHSEVYEKLAPNLDEAEKDWLKAQCIEIE